MSARSLRCQVAGVSHVEGYPNSVMRLWALVDVVGTRAMRVTLVREPGNPHDRHAVQVWITVPGDNEETRWYGYVPKRHSAVVTRALRARRPVTARVAGIGLVRDAKTYLPGIRLDITGLER